MSVDDSTSGATPSYIEALYAPKAQVVREKRKRPQTPEPRLSRAALEERMRKGEIRVSSDVLGRFIREVYLRKLSLREYTKKAANELIRADSRVREELSQHMRARIEGGTLSIATVRNDIRNALIKKVNALLAEETSVWENERSYNGFEVRRTKRGRRTFCFLICRVKGAIITFFTLENYRRSQSHRRARKRDYINTH